MKCPYYLMVLLFPAVVLASEKHQEDPTKIVTKLGASYTDEFAISGSIGLSETKKLNGRVNEDASNWRLGGSWLFNFGIVNFNFSQSEFDDGAHKRNYSIGTFIPLSVFDIEPGGWQIFPMAGYSYNDGELLVENQDSLVQGEYVLTPGTSQGGYAGAFTLKPLTDHWTFMAFAGASRGSDDYSGIWGGAGVSFKISDRQSFNIYGFASDDDFGKQEKLGISYNHEFN